MTISREQPPLDLATHQVLALETREGLLFWPYERVALLMDEYQGRLTVVSDQGEVAHRPGPLPTPTPAPPLTATPTRTPTPPPHPWRLVSPGILGHPAHARRVSGSLLFPGGWKFPTPADWPARTRPPRRHLAATPKKPPAGSPALPQSPPFADPLVSDTGLRASQILSLARVGPRWMWRTDEGLIPCAKRPLDAAREHPHLVRVGRGYVNIRRLRRACRERGRLRLDLDDGSSTRVRVVDPEALARRLGVTRLDHLEPFTEAHVHLYHEDLRDWPDELLFTPADDLRKAFGTKGSERPLMANVVWQTFRLRQQGCPPDYGTDTRGFWYRPLAPILARTRGELLPLEARDSRDARYRLLVDVLGDMVGRERLLTFRDLGFVDPRPDLRCLGDTHPEVLLVCEKASLLEFARETARLFGASVCVTAGQASWLMVEFLCADLLEKGVTEVMLVAYTDFDPQGWLIAEAMVSQMDRYGVTVSSIRHLVRPERFSARELELFSESLAGSDAHTQTILEKWLAASGGIGGEPRGMHADHLRPLERLLKAFAEETGLTPEAQ